MFSLSLKKPHFAFSVSVFTVLLCAPAAQSQADHGKADTHSPVLEHLADLNHGFDNGNPCLGVRPEAAGAQLADILGNPSSPPTGLFARVAEAVPANQMATQELKTAFGNYEHNAIEWLRAKSARDGAKLEDD